MTANQVTSPQTDGKVVNLDLQSTNPGPNQGGHPRQLLNNMIEGYNQNLQKKNPRSGSRGMPGQGVPTG